MLNFAQNTTDEALSLLDRTWEWLASSGITILIIILVAIMARVAAGVLIKRVFSAMLDSGVRVTSVVVGRDHGNTALAQAQRDRREQRVDTLATVVKNVVAVVIVAIAGVMILSELKVNISPILASLGVAGLAAGIGAQTIIKDVLAGTIMLFEDIVSVGDYVDLEYAEGTVENINLRVTQVRGIDGVLWTVRNGEIVRTGNYSRGLGTVCVTLDIDNSASDADVSDAISTVIDHIKQDPQFGPKILNIPEATGILSMDGARYQRRITANTIPGEQLAVSQELRSHIRQEFKKRGIDLALPRLQETQ